MKIQKNIIYITLFCSVVSVLIYAICVFYRFGNYKVGEFVSSLILGVWGSSIISLILGIVSYGENRRRDLEGFIFAINGLLQHCGEYKKENLVEWYETYVKLYQQVSNNWANIGFLFDPRHHRLYLKECIDFYGDFIDITEEKIRIIKTMEEANDKAKEFKAKFINEIDAIIRCQIKIDHGIIKVTQIVNRLTYDEATMIRNINNIYKNKEILSKYVFEYTILSHDNFTLLTSEEEKYIRKFQKIMNKEAKTNIKFCMPLKEARKLQHKNYISGYSGDKDGNVKEVHCNFLVSSYFEKKKRINTKISIDEKVKKQCMCI